MSGQRPRAIILGCAGAQLGDAERQFFRDADPLGFILFKRNIETPTQVRRLTASLRDAVGRADAPILIDQEGGRVARLGSPHWQTLPPARAIGMLAERNIQSGLTAARAAARCIGGMLADLGIDVVCAPVADLLLPQTHTVIGDRAYSADPALVAALATAACRGFRDAGVTPIVKHIPGHGRATSDSHMSLPRIESTRDILEGSDFAAFRDTKDVPWAMVAHCLYSAIDPSRPASVSPAVIDEVIRGFIAYKGVLIADDIGMQALNGSLADRAAATLAAGCDLTLHCSGIFAEMQAIAPAVAQLTDRAAMRLAKARDVDTSSAFDAKAERARLDKLLAA